MNRTDTARLVKRIANDLMEKGVDVAIQPAVTTTSFYLTFDFGILKKCRVGDHGGKGYLYTYEIGDHIPAYREVTETFKGHQYTRYLYPAEQVEDLITQVLILRSNLRAKYGVESYGNYRERVSA